MTKHHYTATDSAGSPSKTTSNHNNNKEVMANSSNSGRYDFRDEIQLLPSSSTVSSVSETAGLEVLANRRWAIMLFSLATVLLFADQNLMSPNLTAMAEEYGFTDEERDVKLGGDIALAFWVLGAPGK